MKTEILSRVSEIIRNPQSPKKTEVDRARETRTDSVELSAQAAKLTESANEVSGEYEKQRAEKVSRLEQLVQNGSYKMNDEIVDQIAQRIIETL
jgi:anti-sigma28 factor (negative regulator of flagellin synthesis)